MKKARRGGEQDGLSAASYSAERREARRWTIGNVCLNSDRSLLTPSGSVMPTFQHPSFAHLSPSTIALPANLRVASRNPAVEAAETLKRTISLAITAPKSGKAGDRCSYKLRSAIGIILREYPISHAASGVFHSPANVTVAT